MSKAQNLAYFIWCITKRFAANKGLCFSNNEKIILSLKNKHKGKRCFVIGNGPSLKIEDLNKIASNRDISIASNKIYLCFNSTNWRPNYYTVADLLVAQQNIKKIKNLDLIKIFPDHFMPILGKNGDSNKQGIHLFFRMLPLKMDRNGNSTPNFSENPLNGFYIGETVTNLNIQLANYLGCNPIYVIGIDGIYNLSSSRQDHPIFKQVMISTGESNHFLPNYRDVGEAWCIPKTQEHEKSYVHAAYFLKSKGVNIYNASRTTIIKAFERIDLESIL